jgi:hypothetical protein
VPRSPEFVGPRFTIQCLELADGSCPAGGFLDSLSAPKRRKLDVLFELMGGSDRYKRKEIERAEEYRQWYLSRG